MIELKPCPFCGHHTPYLERRGTPRQSCIVACGNCGCQHESSDEGERSGESWNERAAPSLQGDAEPARYVVLKASGSRYAYVNDTQLGVTVRRFDVLKGDGWGQAESLAARLNGIVASSTPAKGGE